MKAGGKESKTKGRRKIITPHVISPEEPATLPPLSDIDKAQGLDELYRWLAQFKIMVIGALSALPNEVGSVDLVVDFLVDSLRTDVGRQRLLLATSTAEDLNELKSSCIGAAKTIERAWPRLMSIWSA